MLPRPDFLTVMTLPFPVTTPRESVPTLQSAGATAAVPVTRWCARALESCTRQPSPGLYRAHGIRAQVEIDYNRLAPFIRGR